MTKKEAILKAATRLFAERGFSEVSTADIAACAGVAQGTVFYHFKSKDGVLLAIFEQMFGDFIDGLKSAVEKASTGLSAIEEIIRYGDRFLEHRALEVMVVMRDLPSKIVAPQQKENQVTEKWFGQYYQLLKGLVEKGIDDGSIRSMCPEKGAHLLLSLMMGVARQHLLGPFPAPRMPEELIDFCHQALASSERIGAK